jgi:predicted enzyme related to lactoylglutathione lyase
MLKDSPAFSGFSVNDLDAAQKFYGEILGLDISQDEMGLALKTNGNNTIFIYQKDNHTPASFTILNFPVEDIDSSVDELSKKGVVFEKYEGMHQDEKGIARGRAAQMGPDIAWFKDPAGNILSILH